MNKRQRATANLDAIAEKARLHLSAKDAAREKTLRLCREITRHSTRSIRAVHRHEKTEAEQLLDSARLLNEELNNGIREKHVELLPAGFVHDAQKEFAEASITLALISSKPLPEPETLAIGYPAYLNGMGEAAGELRRYILDNLRRNDFSQCEDLLTAMDDIYSMLVTMDFPEAITYGLRRTTDAVRGILEKTRGDMTMALRQKALEVKLEQLQREAKKNQR